MAWHPSIATETAPTARGCVPTLLRARYCARASAKRWSDEALKALQPRQHHQPQHPPRPQRLPIHHHFFSRRANQSRSCLAARAAGRRPSRLARRQTSTQQAERHRRHIDVERQAARQLSLRDRSLPWEGGPSQSTALGKPFWPASRWGPNSIAAGLPLLHCTLDGRVDDDTTSASCLLTNTFVLIITHAWSLAFAGYVPSSRLLLGSSIG